MMRTVNLTKEITKKRYSGESSEKKPNNYGKFEVAVDEILE